jgi:hypothetical protein
MLKHRILLLDVPTKIPITKKKFTYVSANSIYSTPHFTIRKKIVDYLKAFLKPCLKGLPYFNGPIEISISYYSKRMNYDIDNKGFIWGKVLLDSLKENYIKEDNVKHVKSISYRHIYKENNNLHDMEIIITEL